MLIMQNDSLLSRDLPALHESQYFFFPLTYSIYITLPQILHKDLMKRKMTKTNA